MTKQYRSVYFIAILVAVFVAALPSGAFTDVLDVVTMHDLYKTLNQPPQLEGWSLDGTDPCTWHGVTCIESSVIMISLRGLNLSGYITPNIYNFHKLKEFDISFNGIGGEIPSVLPPKATHINLAYNLLIQNIPLSLLGMKSLRHLNLSHNMLSGPIANVFTGLQNLREMDLSYNNFTGDLPSSFRSLTNLTGLYLQENQFTGSISYLAELPLIDLNIEDNYFSGVIPSRIWLIPHLVIEGNIYLSYENQIHPPPAAQSSAMVQNEGNSKLGVPKKKRLGPGGLALMIGGGTLVVLSVALFVAHRKLKLRVKKLITLRGHVLAAVNICGGSTMRTRDNYDILHPSSEELLPTYTRSRVITNHICDIPSQFRYFLVEDILCATKRFAPENKLGQGLLGSVYKAEFPDGQISVVRNMKTAGLVINEQEKFLDPVCAISSLKHPNIVPLLGYCVEQGDLYLVYKYVRNLTLDEALHGEKYNSLTWGIRLQIALGVAQAMEYLHATLPPAVGHGNLKSANILLDEELAPHICDSGLTIFWPLIRKSLTLKASEDVIGGTGYFAPEHGLPGFDNTKNDIYAFGVLLLELLTGRKPSDSAKSLVKWAALKLNDFESLKEMIDPGIKETCSSEDLSKIADIVSLCIQPVQELRPPMSVVVGSLRQLVYKHNKGKGDGSYLPGQPTPVSRAHLH